MIDVTEDSTTTKTDEAALEVDAVHPEHVTNEDAPSTATEAADTPLSNDADDVREEIDYNAVLAADLEELRGEFPELRTLADVTDLENPLRYAALRDLGLTAAEAYLATTRRRRTRDTRSHLSAAAPRAASAPVGSMSRAELEMARELFDDMSDSDIQALYRKVTK